jgi:hypothetical protein
MRPDHAPRCKLLLSSPQAAVAWVSYKAQPYFRDVQLTVEDRAPGSTSSPSADPTQPPQ